VGSKENDREIVHLFYREGGVDPIHPAIQVNIHQDSIRSCHLHLRERILGAPCLITDRVPKCCEVPFQNFPDHRIVIDNKSPFIRAGHSDIGFIYKNNASTGAKKVRNPSCRTVTLPVIYPTGVRLPWQ
jgi:hypothetical protein